MLQQAIQQLKDDLLLPVNKEMKTLITAIEQSDCSISVEISYMPLDCHKVESVKNTLKDIHDLFKISTQFDRVQIGKVKFSSSNAAYQTPRINAQAPTPIKRSFLGENMGRSSSHDKINFRSTLPLSSASTRDVPLFKKKHPLPVAEICLSQDLLDPKIDDTNLNDFLEGELDRIKKMFLEDSPAPKSSRKLGNIKEKQSLDVDVSKTRKLIIDPHTPDNDLITAFLAHSSRKVLSKRDLTKK